MLINFVCFKTLQKHQAQNLQFKITASYAQVFWNFKIGFKLPLLHKIYKIHLITGNTKVESGFLFQLIKTQNDLYEKHTKNAVHIKQKTVIAINQYLYFTKCHKKYLDSCAMKSQYATDVLPLFSKIYYKFT